MEHATYDGYWWLPENPGHKVAGTLSFDANGVQLLLQGSFVVTDEAAAIRTLANPPDWETISYVYGETYDSKEIVTLLRVQGATTPQGPTINVTNMYLGGVALIGLHISDESFVEIQCGYDYLAGWAQPASIVQAMDGEANSVTVQFGNEEMAAANVDGTEIRLVAGIVGTTSSESVRSERLVKFTDKPSAPVMMAEVIDKWVRGLQDFLIVCLGQSVRLTHFLVRANEGGPWASVCFEAVQGKTKPDVGISSVISYTAPTLVTLRTSPSSFDQLIPAWFDVRAKFGQVLTLLLAPYYAPFIYNEHRFSSIFQSCESLAKKKFASREKSREEHHDRVAVITEAASAAGVDAEDVAWAERVLQSRNDKTMAQRISDLLTSLSKIGAAVLDASPKFAETVARARAGVSHPLNVEMDGASRYWHGDILAWVMRAALLVESGIALEEIEKKVTESAPFRHALGLIRVESELADSGA
jgi:hypothetical protein